MTSVSYLRATSPNGEPYVRRFDTVTAARAAEVCLWMAGWDTKPLLTVVQLGEQDDARVGLSSCSPSCVVCNDAGCEFCKAVDTKEDTMRLHHHRKPSRLVERIRAYTEDGRSPQAAVARRLHPKWRGR